MSDLNIKVDAIKSLLEAFKLERILYVIISCISVGVLLTTAVFIFINNPDKIEWFVGLFIPAGTITYSIGRILKMWNQAIRFISNENPPKNGD